MMNRSKIERTDCGERLRVCNCEIPKAAEERKRRATSYKAHGTLVPFLRLELTIPDQKL
jgi:hypothetical protein